MRRIELDNGLPTQTEFALVSFTSGIFSYTDKFDWCDLHSFEITAVKAEKPTP